MWRAQLAGSGVIDDVFALCFGSVEGDGALMLGDVDAAEYDVALQYTALLSSLAHPHYYSVQLEALWVGGQQLHVKPVRAPSFYVYLEGFIVGENGAALLQYRDKCTAPSYYSGITLQPM